MLLISNLQLLTYLCDSVVSKVLIYNCIYLNKMWVYNNGTFIQTSRALKWIRTDKYTVEILR